MLVLFIEFDFISCSCVLVLCRRYGSLLPEEREDIGFKCKRLIDRGRMHYLMTHGYDVNLIYYVESALTLENTALVAVFNKSTH